MADVVPEWVRLLPHLNASLNGLSALFLLGGYRAVRQKRLLQHRRRMLLAFLASTLFLISYLTYHFYPGVGTVRFLEPAWMRPFYLAVLIPHVILAVPVVPLALLALFFAFRGRYDRHRQVTRFLWPVWVFVSISGVLVYLMLYILFPQKSL
ncbi:MAG: hypothetical protein KatS3mg115_0355 [Candidatus Poribacteria bacterium]|nr:MAG: hypothetical protein KatS3mg115_0355 [Candidatus Poribacteria bacterium]